MSSEKSKILDNMGIPFYKISIRTNKKLESLIQKIQLCSADER